MPICADCYVGACSSDFYRFLHKFRPSHEASEKTTYPGLPQTAYNRKFYETIWTWVTSHSDIRIVHNNEVQNYSLADFESAERHGSNELPTVLDAHVPSPTVPTTQPADSLLALRKALRERLSEERQDANSLAGLCQETLDVEEHNSRRRPRRTPTYDYVHGAVFDDPSSSTTEPRLFASQSRIWQALTGHEMDLKKVPSMEFSLLSIIAANGVNGITQPELTQCSGQDKRSVPHRTDELARKGYVVKNPVQAGKARTSICVSTLR